MRGAFHVTKPLLVVAILTLLALTGLSWGLAYVPLGDWAAPLAIGIAAGKAIVIGLFFMDLAEMRGSLGLVALTAPLWIAIMILLMLTDVFTR